MPHTPGPWRIGDAGHTVFGPPNGNPSPKTIAHNISREDARLIAAAPELLNVCKQLVWKLSHDHADVDAHGNLLATSHPATIDRRDIVAKMAYELVSRLESLDAIAKAEGRVG